MERTGYKFLTGEAAGPLSRIVWPVPRGGLPGAWTDAGAGPLQLCVRGAHVCRPADLAYWLSDELWQVELDGDQVEGIDCLIARRARLVRRLDGWRDGQVAVRFAHACVEHATSLVPAGAPASAYLQDASEAARYGYVAAFATALAVAKAVGDGRADEQAYRLERAWQSAWIAGELAL
jgi:hypothetical protein